MTILEVIKNDHDRMRALLGRLLNNVDSDREKRTDLIRRIRDEVIPHARAEEVAKKLHDELIHHVDEEESDLFPQVKAAFTTEELTEMAEIFKEMKPEIREQGAFQQTLEMVGNLIPPKVTEMFKGDSSAK
jgi:hemerythrin superfamily protein